MQPVGVSYGCAFKLCILLYITRGRGEGKNTEIINSAGKYDDIFKLLTIWLWLMYFEALRSQWDSLSCKKRTGKVSATAVWREKGRGRGGSHPVDWSTWQQELWVCCLVWVVWKWSVSGELEGRRKRLMLLLQPWVGSSPWPPTKSIRISWKQGDSCRVHCSCPAHWAVMIVGLFWIVSSNGVTQVFWRVEGRAVVWPHSCCPGCDGRAAWATAGW